MDSNTGYGVAYLTVGNGVGSGVGLVVGLSVGAGKVGAGF